MTLAKQAKELGLSKDFFYVMKSINKDKYQYILSLDDDLIKAYYKYIDECSQLFQKLEQIYWTLYLKHNIHAFSKFLHYKKVYKNYNTFSTTINSRLFKVSNQTSFSSMLKNKQIIEAFDVFSKKFNIVIDDI